MTYNKNRVDITAFIRELLFGHDCVIIPGFGGFIGNYTPARIDKNSGTFYPPVKQISFNRNLNHNDGLLVGRISGSENLNYGDARSMVEEFVAGICRKLDKGEKIVFDHIGSFLNNQEGNLQFEPDRSANYHLDSYGLESFQCLPLEGYDVRKRIARHADRDPVRQAAFRKTLWRAAVIVPLLSLIVAVPLTTDLFKSRVESSSMNPLVTVELEHNKMAVDEAIVAKETNANVSFTAPIALEQAPSEIAETEVAVANEYYLITGSFKSEENASRQAAMLREEGFVPEVVIAPNGFYRVSAMMCSDLNTAIIRKDSISKKFPGSWVSRKK
jgi:nucleoid DNA-binding protein